MFLLVIKRVVVLDPDNGHIINGFACVDLVEHDSNHASGTICAGLIDLRFVLLEADYSAILWGVLKQFFNSSGVQYYRSV